MPETTTSPGPEASPAPIPTLPTEAAEPSSENRQLERLLDDWNAGDPTALDRVLPLVYEALLDIARREFRRENPGHTLQPTAVVHEAFLRLRKQRKVQWRSKSEFFGVVTQNIRRILIEHSRAKNRQKRGGGARPVSFDDALHQGQGAEGGHLLVDRAFRDLAELHPRQSRVAKLRILVGLGLEEIAQVLGVSRSTVARDWRTASLWLRRELSARSDSE